MQTLEEFAREHDLARTNVVIEEWTGKTGVALVARATGMQVSPVVANPQALEAWFAREGERISGFVSRGWDVPPDSFLRRVDAGFGAARRRFSSALGEAERDLDRARRFVVDFADETDPGTVKVVRRSRDNLPRDEDKVARCREAVAGVDRLAGRLKADPASLVLPVGALVRLRDTNPGRSIGPSNPFDSTLPRAGTQGVVVGLSDAGGGWTTKVAFGRPYFDRSGTQWLPEPGEPIKKSFDADDLEVVALGTFHDGTPCRSVTFRETHRRPEDMDKADPGTLERVVLQDGLAWRLWEFKGTGPGGDWYDAQGWESLDELDFLAPLGADPAAPAP